MIKFFKDKNYLILAYSLEIESEENWVDKALEEDEQLTLKRTFTLLQEHIYITRSKLKDEEDDIFGTDYRYFLFAREDGEYYRIFKGILTDKFEILLHKDIPFDLDLFVVDSNVSIIRALEPLLNEDLYIGGTHQQSIPWKAYQKLISDFPNSYEKKRYVEARVSSILREYIETLKDGELMYNKYMNKKSKNFRGNLKKLFKESELEKYSTILEKLQKMLASEDGFTEKHWQEEILQILLLLYPKYLYVFREVPIKDHRIEEKKLDYLLVDSAGYVDIIEIKKPFDKAIVTEGKYRNNFIPLRELSGTIMQLEKYIFYLNRWGDRGEKFLTQKYESELSPGFEIKITNPSGIIIMGRENNLSVEQKADFEVVKRKYKNVVDIITYDNLINRLKATIDQIQKL